MSVVANVAINVDSRSAVGSLRQVIATSEQLNASIQKLTNTLEQQQQQLNNTTKQAKSGFQSLILTLGGVTAAYANLQAAQKALQTGIQREESIRRLQFLARGYDEVTQAQLAAARAGQQFGLSTTQANQQFAQLYGRLRPLNVTLQDIETVFVGFNTAAKVSGATSAETAGAFLQLTQALGSGVLRGQELNSVLEQAPGLVVALTKELDRPVSEIRKLAEQGKITSDIVIKALQRAAKDGADELTSAMEGPSQQIKNLQNAFEEFQVAVVQNILPLAIEAVKKLTQILQNATQYVKDFGAGWTIISGAINAALAPFEGLLTILGQIDSRLRSIGQQPALNMLAGLLPGGVLSPILNAPADIGRGARKTAAGSGMFGRYAPGQNQIPFERSISNVSRGIAGGSSGGSNKAAREAERAAERAAQIEAEVQGLQRQVALTKQLTFLDEQIANAEAAKDQQLAIRLKGEEKLLQLRYQLADELAKAETQSQRDAALANATAEADRIRVGIALELSKNEEDRQKTIQDVVSDLDMELIKLQATTDKQKQAIRFLEIENQLKSQGIVLTDGDAEAIRRKIAELDKANKTQEAITAKLQMEKDLFEGIANTVAGAFSGAINAAVSGTENLGEALKKLGTDLLATIGQMLIMYSIAQAFGALGGKDGVGVFSFLAKAFGFKSAEEGAYWSGGFQAFANGGMVDRPTLGLVGEGGESEYIIPASKMRLAMSRYAAGARGSAVIPAGNDTSSGGGTATMAPAAIDVRYTVERINSVDYVTADQFRAGMAQAAQQGATQGEQRTLRRLQQSRATRSRLGMN